MKNYKELNTMRELIEYIEDNTNIDFYECFEDISIMDDYEELKTIIYEEYEEDYIKIIEDFEERAKEHYALYYYDGSMNGVSDWVELFNEYYSIEQVKYLIEETNERD